MLALHSGSPGLGHVQAVIVVTAIMAVIFWRDVVKIMLMVALLLLIILIAFGAAAFIEGVQQVMR